MQNRYSKLLFFFLLFGIWIGFFTGCKSKDRPLLAVNPADTSLVPGATEISCWITTPDQSELLKKQERNLIFKSDSNQFPTIVIDTSTTYQEMDGFGFSLTGGSAFLINKLAESDRETLLNELFGSDATSIGISYLRISIGASRSKSVV